MTNFLISSACLVTRTSATIILLITNEVFYDVMSIIDIYNINRIKKQVFQKSYTTDSPDKTQIITGVRSELLHNVFRSLC